MAVDLECARAVFELIDPGVLSAIKTICGTAKQSMQALKTQLQATNLSIDIDLFPLQLKKQALDAIIKEARNAAKIIPAEMVVACPQLGAINTTAEAAIVGKLEALTAISYDIDRLVGVKASFSANIAQVDTAVEYLDAVITEIDNVLGAI